ncbi:hypothetical protein DPMN_054232 [Dreissena polymorpha]|uniref:B box-type domain-containing protein n=1 Tax=Dreissena polymorpha TaxID=45954 RepID=A0A9D4HSW6_DREPO|nr:hypothetical protein DPMN_054232 [Dreissena polymorpha]
MKCPKPECGVEGEGKFCIECGTMLAKTIDHTGVDRVKCLQNEHREHDAETACQPCKRKHKSETATRFYKSCTEFLCNECSNNHQIYIPGRHDLVNIQNMKTLPVVVDVNRMDMCKEHNKEIEFFCEDHSKLCCSTCAFIHRKCDTVEDLHTPKESACLELKTIKDSLITLGTKIDSFTAFSQQLAEDLNIALDNIVIEAETIESQILKRLKDEKHRLMVEIENVKTEETTKFSKAKVDSPELKTILEDIFPICSTVLEHGSPTQKVIVAKRVGIKLKALENKQNEHRDSYSTPKVSAAFCRNLVTLINNDDNMLNLNVEYQSANKARDQKRS